MIINRKIIKQIKILNLSKKCAIRKNMRYLYIELDKMQQLLRVR